MKLNYKRTLYVGFAFLLICVFWQAYDSIIPKILNDKFGMDHFWSGVVMSIDNVLALFMLPLFGAISDKCKSPRGKRTPFIIIGTVIAVVAFFGMTIADGMQLKQISEVEKFDSSETLSVLYEYDYGDQKLETPSGKTFSVKDFSKEEWMTFKSGTVIYVGENGNVAAVAEEDGRITIASASGDELEYADLEAWKNSEIYTALAESKAQTINPYIEYVAPARAGFAHGATSENPAPLIAFLLILLAALVAMATFRSPAVALMPDVTIKPLRSKANAVINLMGSLGGAAVLALGIVMGTGKLKNQLMDYTLYIAIICGVMLAALAVFLFKVKEPKFVADMQKQSAELGIDETESTSESRRLTSGEKISLALILASVVLWFMGYNAVSSKYSVYATSVLAMDYNTSIIIGQAAAIISYFPVGIISTKVGRRKTILAGIVILCGAVTAACFMTATSSPIAMNIIFALCGIGWATINVNSFPMVVELAKGGNIGKYTGYYYTASMAAQIATPILSGFIMDRAGMQTLFPYAAIFVGLAFFTMLFVKHGDSKPLPKKDVLESLGEGD